MSPSHHGSVPALPLPAAAAEPEARDPDRENWLALRGGEDRALDAIIRRWERPLHAFAWRYLHNSEDADDLVAETFVKLYGRRLQLRPDTRLSAWLFTALANLCHNRHRWRRRHPTISLDGASETGVPAGEQIPAEDRAPDSALEKAESDAILRTAIDRLPHDQKTALLLHSFEQMSYREIGRIAGCGERGVETRLYRARRQLRAALEAATDR